MTADTLVQKLMEYYKGQYSPERMAQLKRFCENIPDADRGNIYTSITEERKESTAIGVYDIKKACQILGVPYTETVYIKDEKVTCDCCGEQYKYSPCPSDEQMMRFDIHDHCPNCGFQRGWTIQAEAQIAAGQPCAWYERYLDKFEKNGYGTGKPQGRWYKKDRDEKAIAQRNRDIVDAKIAMVRRHASIEV